MTTLSPPTQDIYIPAKCTTLAAASTDAQIRLGLQGKPKIGKTFNALTFPNPIVLNLDRGLGAHAGREDVIEVPFFDTKFTSLISPNRKDAIVKWLETEGMKLTSKQTLILDSSTQLQNIFNDWYQDNPVISNRGVEDKFGEWKMKLKFFGEICELIKLLRCHVIYICHETAARDDSGELNGKVRPLLTGQFGDQLASHFTDWFRCHAIAKPFGDENIKKMKERYKLDDATTKEWIASTPEKHETIYLWQTTSDDIFDGGSSSLFNKPKYILANYNSFAKYRKQNNS